MESLVTVVTFLALPWVYLRDLVAQTTRLAPELSVSLVLAGLTAINLRKPHAVRDNLMAMLGLVLPFLPWLARVTVQGESVGFSNRWLEPLAILSLLAMISLIGFVRYKQSGQARAPLFWGLPGSIAPQSIHAAAGKVILRFLRKQRLQPTAW